MGRVPPRKFQNFNQIKHFEVGLGFLTHRLLYARGYSIFLGSVVIKWRLGDLEHLWQERGGLCCPSRKRVWALRRAGLYFEALSGGSNVIHYCWVGMHAFARI